MPNPKRAYTYSITTKDGKRHDTRVSNIENYGIQSYVEAYPGATIHMRDKEGKDYDIPLEHYEYARSQGFRPFTTEYPVKDENNSRPRVETRQGPAQDVNPKAESDTGGTRVRSAKVPMTEMQKRGYMMELASSAANTIGSGEASVQRLRNQAEYTGKSIGRYGQAVETAPRFNVRTGELEKTYLTPQGVRTSSRGAAEMAAAKSREAFDNSIEGQLRRAEERRDELERQLHARGQEIEAERKAGEQSMGMLGRLMSAGNDMARGGAGASGTVNTQTNNGRYTDERYIQLEEAIRQTDDLITTLRRQRDRENGEDVGILRTLRDEGANLLYYLDPNAQSRTARAMLSANDNPELESAQILLGQSLLSQQAHANYDTNENNRSRWTRIAVQSLPFMLDMISSNWATGAFRGGAKLATKATLRAFGKEAVEQMARQGFKSYVKANGVRGLGRAAGNWTIKQLGNSADDFMRGAFVSNAAQTGKTALGITEQKLGGIEYNENNGKLEYEDDGTWSDAVWQGGMDAAIESMSEFSGEHWEGALKKLTSSAAGLLGLRRLSKILGAANSRSLGRINNTMQRAFRKAGINGFLGEVGEEYYGQLWRTMLGLDSAYQQNPDGTRTNLFGTGQFHGDIWGGMALSIGMMKAVGTPVSAANYLSMRHDVNKASAIAGEALTPEVWNPLRETIDNTTNDDMGVFVTNFVRDGEFTQEEKSAVMDYIERVMYLRGANLADVARSRGGELDPFNLQLGQDYMAGYGLDSDEQMQDARNAYVMMRQDLLSRIPPETLARIEQDPAAAGEIQDEQTRRMAAAYLRSKNVYDGMIKRVQDDIDTRVAQTGAMIDSRVNSDTGTIIPVTMKSQDANGNSRQAYVTSGNLIKLEDGTGIDMEKSSGSITVRYADTSELEMVSPGAILSVSETLSPEHEKSEAERNIRLDYAQRLADRIDGRVSFIPGGTFVMTSQEGKQTAVTIVADENGSIENENGEINLTVDGGKTIFHLTKEEIQGLQDITNQIRARERMHEVQEQDQPEIPARDYETGDIQLIGADGHTIEAQIIEVGDETNGELGRYLVQTDGSIEGKAVVDWYSREELDGLTGRVQETAQTEQTQQAGTESEEVTEGTDDEIPAQDIASQEGTLPVGEENLGVGEYELPVGEESLQAGAGRPSALERIPKDEQGQPLYEQADPDTAWDAIVEQAGGDEAMAQSVADSMVSDKEAELKKVEKAKPKGGATIAEKIAAERERKNAVEQAKANLALWQKIAQTSQRRRQAAIAEQSRQAAEAARLRREQEEQERAAREEAERIRREALNGVPDFVDDTPQDARARGYRRVNGEKVDRQQSIPTRQGKEVQVKFDDKNIPTGHVALIDASQLQPSHINGHRNPAHFIDEAQPKERNDDASVMSARRIAANIRPEEITSSVTAYTGAPTVNTRGEVIQGNNRSAALREMWASYPEQAAKYKQYLKEHAADFGLAPEDVEAMQQPVLVNMIDVPDEATITLGQFVAQDTESGGSERIKPKNLVQRMGHDMGTFANRLLASPDEEASFPELVDSNGTDVLKWMQQKGYITPTQYNSAFDSKGNLTAEAKNDLKGVMYQSIFQNGNTHLEEMFGMLPAKAQKAILATAYRDYDSPNTERMNEEIQSSIQAYYALLQDPDFAAAKNYKEARIAAEAWKRQYAMDDVTGESYLPSERYSNFALLLAAMYKGQTQTFIQNTFANIYDLVQGTQEATLFEEPDNTPRTLVEAINETLSNLKKELLLNGNFIYNGQRRNNVLAGSGTTGQPRGQGSNGSAPSGGRDEDGTRTADDNRGTESGSGERRADKEHPLSSENTEPRQITKPKFIDPRSMSDNERLQRGDMLRNAQVIDVETGIIVNTKELSARKVAERWWDENVPEPVFYDTEAGEVEINKNSIESSLAHRYGQAKLDAITSLVEGFENAVYLGTMPDSNRQEGVYNHYFAYPINYNGNRNYVFCRAMQDANKNRLYVHEVFVADNIKKGDTLQTAASQPHGGIALYRSILANVLGKSQNRFDGGAQTEHRPADVSVTTSPTDEQGVSVYKNTDKSSVTQTIGEKVAQAEAETEQNPTEAQKEAGNYKKGHVRIGQFDITVENPKGSVRRGVDKSGKAWEQTMRNTYGYIRGTEGVDGDHIDAFLTNDIDGWNGRRVYIVDQYNEDGTFDEHKVMLGFNDEAEAQDAYLSNYEKGWSFKRKLVLSSVNLPDFEKWINSSHRKTKPFAEYKSVRKEDGENKDENALVDEAHKAFAEIISKSTRHIEILNDAISETGDTLYAPIKVDGKATNLSLYQTEPVHITEEPIVGVSYYREGLTYQEASDLAEDYNRYVGKTVCADGEDALEVCFGNIDEAVRFEQWQEERDSGSVRYNRNDEKVLTNEEVALRDAVVERLRESGIDVITDVEAGQRVLDEANGRDVSLNARQKRALETASVSLNETSSTAISSADGAKVVKSLDTLARKYENRDVNQTKTFIDEVADALGINAESKSSKYATFEAKNGKRVTIRLSNHNARVSNFDNNDEVDGISIVVIPAHNNGILNDGNAHIVEFYYNVMKLRRSEGKPLADIVKSIRQALYSGEYKDTTGLVEVEEVNADAIREHRVYHGSGADFSAFDHSHMGEGEGAQAYGWGSYVTEVEGIGRTYAKTTSHANLLYKGNSLSEEEARRIEGFALPGETFDELKRKFEDFVENGISVGRSQSMLDILNKTLPDEWENPSRHLYTVEIPDDTGENYLEWDGRADRLLEKAGISDEEYEDNDMASGADVYHYLTSKLGSDKAASEYLSDRGFTGISYPANNLRGDSEDDASNYVIFNEEDLKITDHVRFFRTQGGEAYGFTVGGKIYIDPRIATADTPIHEYAHLWASALRQGNPEEWRNVVELMKDTLVWDEVKRKYPELKTDDEIADEVLATYSGRRGAERLREEATKASDGGGLLDKAAAMDAQARVREALRRFWKGVSDMLHIHFTTAEEAADRVMLDFLEGVNPVRNANSQNGEIRFQLKEPVEEQHNLIALHNLNEGNLKAALELGGFPMPSIAVTKADLGHAEFGEISLVFDKNSINPTDRRNHIYGGDAWTPTFPQVGYKLDEDKTSEIYSRANKAGRLPLFNPESFHSENYKGHINGLDAKSLVEHFKNDYGAKQLYLYENGNPVENLEQHAVEKYPADKVELYEKMLEGIGLEKLREEPTETLENEVKKFLEEHGGVDFDGMKPFRVKVRISNAIRNAVDYATNGNKKTETDIEATQKKIDRRINKKTFEEWLTSLFDGVVEKKGIRNERDMFTPSGNRRRWEQLYDAITLDNVVKAMERQSSKGGQGLFGGSIFGAAQRDITSLQDLRDTAKKRLNGISEEEYEKKRSEITDRLSAIKIPGAGTSFSDSMDMVENITDAVRHSHRSDGIYRYLKSIYKGMTKEVAEEISGIVKDIQEMSTRYFEAKPYRAVGFDEVRLAVVPRSADKELVQKLKERGIPVKTYKTGDQENRKQVLNAAAEKEDLLFREADDGLNEANDQFNEELRRYDSGEMDKNEMFHLGNPNGVMRMFLPNIPIVMRQRIMTKGSVKKHNIEPTALENMPQHLSEPIFVFQRADNVLGVLTEMKDRDGKNVCVAISLSQTIQDGKDVLEVNDIRSIHGRNEADIIYPIVQNNTLVWADKEKGLAWLSSASQSVQQEIDKQDLVSAANIIRNFENPSVEEENLREESVSTDNESPDLYRRAIGGNSGYVGYSKSKRAVRAENAGLRNKSQMDAEFASEVNDIIASENPDQPKVTLKEIKQSLKNIKPDEWHHTSMYGNRTNYYSARNVADYFLERTTQTDDHEREQMLAQASERINRADDALYEHVQAQLPLEYIDTQIGKRKAYKSSNGLYVEVNRSFKSNRVYAIGELAGESYLFVDRYSDWVYDSAENRKRFEEAVDEANEAQQEALEDAPRELKDELQKAKDDYESIRESGKFEVSQREGSGALTDDDLSTANDPVSKLLGKSTRTAAQRRAFAERERGRMVQRVQELAKKLHLDNVDIVTDVSTLQGNRAKAKGFFSRSTGRITIVIPNHTSVFDAEQTLLHEAVAHYGLRELFGEHFDTFLDNVFQNADADVSRHIVELAKRRGWDFPTATEEYLASLAENTNFENMDAGWWKKIKALFLRMLHKIGFENFSGVTLSDNELRYILWRSYENLAEPGRYRSILGEAEDVAKQNELKVGNFAPTAAIGGQVAESANSVKAERIRRLRESKPVEITGEEYRGKYELNRDSAQKYVLDNLRGEYTIKDTGEKVNLSKVGAKKVTSHSMGNEAHLKSIAAIPQLISNAIFIEERPPYKEGAQYDSYRYYVTGLKINGEDYTVRMTIGVKNGKYYYDHYLTNIEKGNLIEIAQGFTPTEDAPNPSYAGYKDKVLLSILKENEEENLLYRQGTDENMDEGDGTSPLSGPTIQAWDKIANSTKFKLTETAFDYLNAVDKFQKLIAEHSGKPVKDFENAYDALTFLSSRNREEMDMFDSFFVKPLNKAIVALTGKADGRRNWKWERGPLRELVMYVEAKHGTERNRQMAVEAVAREDKENASSIMQAWSEAKKRINGQDGLSWTEKQAQLDEAAKSLGADVAQDYSGLSSVFGNTEQYPEGWNDAARAYVTQYEGSHGQDKTSALWHAINNATGFTLQKQYETGLVSREYVERQRERFENYIPLRGFENDTAGDVYNYIGQDYYPGGNPVKTAHGRTSEPGNPFGSILNTAYASISSGNKNVAKTAFYSLVMNHDTGGLAVPRRAWKVRYADLKSNPELERIVASPKLDNDEEIPEWIEAVPRIPENGTPEEIARVLGEFESVMNKYSEEGATEPIWKKSQIAYRTLYKERDQHEIPLYIAGDKYVITITGNPRVAQAVNGLLNPNSGNENKWLEFAKKVQRFMAGAFTAKNAAFSLANLSRDTIYANNQIFIRENIRYWLRFTKNQKAGFGDYPQIMRRLYKYRSGKLDMNDKTERLFAEFMRNGGATGYTFVNTQEEYAKELEKKLRQLSKGRPDWYTPKGAVNLAFDCIEFAGQSAELVNRFAAYRTSREMGRNVSRSIRDAKEITVNFNRKGAGRKTLSDKNAWYVNLAASTSEYGLDFMLFWNANMQGRYRFFKNLREHPVKTGVTMIGNSMLISAVMLPLLNNIVLPALYSMFGSGDDDGDKDRDDAANDYFNSLTDYERTRNICIRLPKGNWLKIPISPDMAPWFTIGDAVGGQISGQRDIKASDVVHSMVDAASPLSINWSYKGYARALNVLPTVTQPIAQNMMNVNFMGNPIRKSPFTTKQGKNPQYTMVYRNASPTLVELSRLSNRLTGGEDDKSSGEADWNPSMVQNLISGYTGGYGTTFLSLADWIVGTSKGEKQAVTFSKMPFVSRFAISGNKDVRLQRINSRFYEVRDFVMDFEFDRDRYLKRIAEGQKEHDSMKVAEGMTLYNDLIHSHRAAKYNRLARISGAVDAYEKYLKEFPDDEATRNQLYQIKSSGIDVLREEEEENPGARK